MIVEKHQKFVFVSLALACALSALWLQFQTEEKTFSPRAQAVMRNSLLGNALPFEALLVKSGQPEVQKEFQNSLALERVESDPTLVRVSAKIENPAESRTRMERAQEILTKAAQAIVTAESRETARNLRKIEKPTLQKPKKVEVKRDRRKPALSAEERQTAIRLKMETQDLASYVDGGSEPSWLEGRIDRNLYKRTLQELTESKQKLHLLKKTYKGRSSKVKAQETDVARLSQALRNEKVHLAEVLLKSQEEELAALDQKALENMKHNASIAAREEREVTHKEEADESINWADDMVAGYEKEQQALATAATFHIEGEVELIRDTAKWYWLRLFLWLSSALFLLMALFKPENASEDDSLVKNEQLTASELMLHRPPTSVRVEAEPQLEALLSSIRSDRGRDLKRYLVLGASQGDSRPVLTVRLAKTIAARGERVRLVDFDLSRKLLSSKLGNYNTAGVTDLIKSKMGPTEEFLAPLSGTSIEFAPAGNSVFGNISPEGLESLSQLLKPRPDGNLIVDASFESPLSLILNHVDAVICVTSADKKWNEQQTRILLHIREANKPIWGLFQGDDGAFPFS